MSPPSGSVKHRPRLFIMLRGRQDLQHELGLDFPPKLLAWLKKSGQEVAAQIIGECSPRIYVTLETAWVISAEESWSGCFPSESVTTSTRYAMCLSRSAIPSAALLPRFIAVEHYDQMAEMFCEKIFW